MKPYARSLAAAVPIALAALPVASASAQDPLAKPASGAIVLEAGFADDPRTLTVISGGPVNAAETIPGCSGHVSEAPDIRLTYIADPSPDALPLFIHALSQGDTTLVVKAPDGNWYCSDDGVNAMNPMLVFGPAMSGDYAIWLGSFEPDRNHEAILAFSELGPDPAPLEAALGGTRLAAPGR
jgi:hypothetical protein